MSRRVIAVTNDDSSPTMKELAEKYIELNDRKSELKNEISPIKSTLKTFMENMIKASRKNESALDTDIGTLRLYYRKDKPKLDEEGLIEYFRDSPFSGEVIKTKEYIDTDVLESLIYNDKVDTKEVSKFIHNHETPVLTIKRNRKKENK